ncbi:hypothetical protein Goklo_011768 [Gossypium klotzschianum]|uniref:Uncharacterized protein n=1 Tax=Gossypium klotzschianum TaxID=34286 RepID=A0A7J8VA36_9ROSI|nr:hypothetical protein [Gossypium klotzschianum]
MDMLLLRVSFLRALIISPNISRSLPLISLGKHLFSPFFPVGVDRAGLTYMQKH